MAVFAVGDIQGCYEQLRRLLDKARFDPARDRLWSVGDMINRGPASLQTLRFLKSLGPALSVVLGNHDLHFLAVACGAKRDGKVQTLLPLLNAPDCSELFEWVRHLPLAHLETLATATGPHKYLMVHAGIAPDWKFRTVLANAAEVQQALQGPEHKDFLAAMYGDKPDRWDPTLSGLPRLRVITNVLTRIRFCKADGTLDMSTKGEQGSAPPGFQPWFHFRKPRPGKSIVFGHWAMLDGNTGRPDIIGLDTGCVWGRCLTLLQLDGQMDAQLNKQQPGPADAGTEHRPDQRTRISVDCHDV